MKKIYSKVDPALLLHVILRKGEITLGKIELSDPKEFIQVMALRENKDRVYKAHKHAWKEGGKTLTQESWIVVQGKLKGIYYDTDGTLIEEVVLESGDSSVTFYGGHNVQILEEDTIFYEIKTGPYLGIEYDKVLI